MRFKKIIAYTLIGLMSIGWVCPVSADTETVANTKIRVGLLYGLTAVSQVNFSTQINLCEFGYYDTTKNSYHSVASVGVNSKYYPITCNSNKSVKLQEFNEMSPSIYTLYKKMIAKGYPTYIAFGNGKFSVFIGSSNDSTYLNKILNTEKKEYANAIIITPTSRSLMVNAADIKFIFDSSSDNVRLRLKEKMVNGVRGAIKLREKGYYAYIGYLELKRVSSKIQVVNELPMEDYLYGVVPYEMTDSWPIEALKAQAVAARSYAYRSLKRYNSYGFDVDDTVNCQVFYGYNIRSKNSIKAINDTRSVVGLYNGQVIQAFFSSCSGDYTMSNSQVWGSTQLPYLVPKRNEYDYLASRYKWTYSTVISGKDKYGRSGLIDTLKAKGKKASNGSYLTNVSRFSLEYYKSIEGADTRVKTITIYDNNGNYVKMSGGSFCYMFYKEYSSNVPSKEMFWSSYFRIKSIPNTMAIGSSSSAPVSKNILDGYAINGAGQVVKISSLDKTQMTVRSANSQTTVDLSNQNMEISGEGWGHGIGMSQWGANAMAQKGFKYDVILKYYYTGITVDKK